MEISDMPLDSNILNSICYDIQRGLFAQEVLDHIDPNCASTSKAQYYLVDYNQLTWQNDMLFYKDLLYVLVGFSHLKVLQHCYDTYMVGYFM
jgi:hypothetical protein